LINRRTYDEVAERQSLPGATGGALQQPTLSYTREYGAPPPGTDTALDQVEGDVYRMMLRAASITEKMPTVDGQVGPGPAARRQAAPDVPDEAVAPGPTERPRQVITAAGQHVDALRALLDRPIDTFAGTAKTLANDAFKKAETHLAQARYYDAVTAYDIARAADPGNPLIWIGRGHALIGAGDYLSASASLEEGLRRFPEIGRFRIDLKAFLRHGDILDIRRADLERRLDEKENYRLRFLLGYIETFSGLEKFGLPNLKQAAKDAPTTSPISTFPKMLSR
jgi:hypothetical protein